MNLYAIVNDFKGYTLWTAYYTTEELIQAKVNRMNILTKRLSYVPIEGKEFEFLGNYWCLFGKLDKHGLPRIRSVILNKLEDINEFSTLGGSIKFTTFDQPHTIVLNDCWFFQKVYRIGKRSIFDMVHNIGVLPWYIKVGSFFYESFEDGNVFCRKDE